MSRRRILVVLAVTLTALANAAAAAAPPVPSSMAALGDSITRGFNACGWYIDCPSRSWSTGSSSLVNSHYLRILTKNPAISGRNYNDARTGAKMTDLNGQAAVAAAQAVDYVTIEMGANDACTSTEAAMTPVATFRAQFELALATMAAQRPTAAIFVASIPDLKRLWQIGRFNLGALTAWSVGGVCQSMLANPLSNAQADVDRRTRVRQRVIDYNAVLAQACAVYATCRFDGNAVFNYQFTLSHVSGWDYFHPNTTGQRVLAEITYAVGFGW